MIENMNDMLPPSALELFEALGVSDAIAVIDGLGGAAWYIPTPHEGRQLPSQINIIALVGERLWGRLQEHFAGRTLSIPTCAKLMRELRNQAISRQYEEGIRNKEPVRMIAFRLGREYKLTAKQINQIVYGYGGGQSPPDQNQLPLF